MTMRKFTRGLVLATLAGWMLAGAERADAGGGRHPYFDDRGTLVWYTELAEAKRAARRLDKVIFVEYGRSRCTQCRKLCAQVLPDKTIRSRMSKLCVGLAAECDEPEPEVKAVFRSKLAHARMLPFIAFLTPSGTWIHGFAGRRTTAQFARDLTIVEAAHRKTARSTSRRKPAPAKPRRVQPRKSKTLTVPCDPKQPVAKKPDGWRGPLFHDCDGECANGQCGAPRFDPIPPSQLSRPKVQPGPRVTPGRTAAAKPRPRPAAPPPAPSSFGSPDGDAPPTFAPPPPPQPVRTVPAPNLPPSRPTAVDLNEAFGSPDSELQADDVGLPPANISAGPRVTTRPHGGVFTPSGTKRASAKATAPKRAAGRSTGLRRIEEAAARGQWRDVLAHAAKTKGTPDPALRRLVHQAHVWAHAQLKAARQAILDEAYVHATKLLESVSEQMDGHAEAIDAERGLEAVELAQDLRLLPTDSPVRRAVQKNAYEAMRGTRWAGLFD